jgi:hypothetical protein
VLPELYLEKDVQSESQRLTRRRKLPDDGFCMSGKSYIYVESNTPKWQNPQGNCGMIDLESFNYLPKSKLR